MQTYFLILDCFFMRRMSLMHFVETTNIKLQVCEFEPKVTTVYVQSTYLFAW